MIEEVRRQFTTIPALTAALQLLRKHEDKPVAQWPIEEQNIFHAADGKAEYGKCVEISTKAAIRQMVLPGLMAVVVPVLIAFLPGLGVEALGGMLAGVTVVGVLMAIFQSNAGGAWDNAKKSLKKVFQSMEKCTIKNPSHIRQLWWAIPSAIRLKIHQDLHLIYC
jgi:K(+)-stimulated pyrophosphate-energized sodium pump